MRGRIRRGSNAGNENISPDNTHSNSYEPIPGTIKAVKARLSEIFSGCSDFTHGDLIQEKQLD